MKIQTSILTEGWVRKELALKLVTWSKKVPFDVGIEFTEEKPISHVRNSIVKRFLETDKEFLLMIDADVIPSKNPFQLVHFNKDVIVCPCPIYQKMVIWNIYEIDKEGYWKPIDISDKSGLVEVVAAGTGCILIHRRVLEKISAPFERMFNEDGLEELGLDLSFSKKVKENNFNIHASLDHKCAHYKTFNLNIL